MRPTDSAAQLRTYFEEQIQLVLNLSLPRGSRSQLGLYRKALLVSLIDCLAGIRFDKKNYPELSRSNQRRFIRLVDECGDWSFGARVSTAFLVSRLKKERLVGPLYGRVAEHLAKFDTDSGGSHSIESMDFPLCELRHLAQGESEDRALLDLQHSSLLYRYRNHLVHEFREPGYGMEVFAEREGDACYHGYGGEPDFVLVYPVDLFGRIASAANRGVSEYFALHGIDPELRISDTTRW